MIGAGRHLQGKPAVVGESVERASGRAMTIVSRGALESMGESEYGLKAVGTGPFKVTEHQLGQSMTLERFGQFIRTESARWAKVIRERDIRVQ